ncbi:SDR family oxidoreductase [Halioglobus maricola]|uniref:SDR family oxidoreductase n=1 Tax=Halioglobus maricola TaxID=2601894 RepID=A0A5P9NJL3_9GAMM|nr:SDR family oxidoreductase [Halioglobus maricola]QFU75158.1 SDR family oxidoreductase [Halioglobus maricola]
MGRVSGKVALVTGAASGLGLAIAQRLAEEGAEVVLADVARESGEMAAQGLANASFAYLDVTSESAWQALIGSMDRLDVLVNCAGVVELASIEHTTEDIWRKINAVGTDGTFYGCKHALASMKAQGSGSIINMCSTASIQGGPNIFAYAASKSAIRGMTKSVACLSTQEGYGIRCNSVHPGNMQTPMLSRMYDTVLEHDPEAAADMDKLWVGDPVDVANMVLFLASDEARSVNGAEMVVDNTTSITEGAVLRHDK